MVVCVVALLCGVILLGLVFPLILQQRVKSRLLECENNLIRVGKALHAYHDRNGGIAPTSRGPGRLAHFGFLYTLGISKDESISLFQDDPSLMAPRWVAMSEAAQKEVASQRALLCPARRAGTQMSSSTVPGPVTDYAITIVYEGPDAGTWTDYYDPCSEQIDDFKSAFRAVKLTAPDACTDNDNPKYNEYELRDDFDSVLDGGGYTLAYGEKHVRAGEFGRCCGDDFQSGSDGSYLFADDQQRMYSFARSAALPLANSPHQFDGQRGRIDGGPGQDFSFGSWHPGVVNFARVDGSVTALNVEVSVQLLRAAAHISDGTEASASVKSDHANSD